MELPKIRLMIVVTISCLVIYQFGTWISAFAGGVWGLASALVVGVVSFVCSRLARAGAGEAGWFMVPTLLFTIIPLATNIWNALTQKKSIYEHIFELTPLFIGFVFPIILLLIVYSELRKKTL